MRDKFTCDDIETQRFLCNCQLSGRHIYQIAFDPNRKKKYSVKNIYKPKSTL